MRKSRLLLVRDFRRQTGGNIKVRDYFRHAAAHPRFEARAWFPPQSRHRDSEIWEDLAAGQVSISFDPAAQDFICVNGRDWALLPDDLGTAEIIHFVQHAGYATDPVLRSYLERPARRLFTSQALFEAIGALANGPAHVVPIGVDPVFQTGAPYNTSRRVTILCAKQPDFAAALAARLEALDLEPAMLDGAWRPHNEYLGMMRRSEILVTLPLRREGFYLPALEGMGQGCAVICCDAVGNRGHCVAGETCLQPAFGDVDGHVAAVEQLIRDDALKAHLRAGGARMARRHGMAQERAAFHTMLDAALADQEARRLGA
ncbi:MAG TPA: hypothetical protein VIT38_03600 [Allosphingosinicella sp.]